MNEKLLIEQVVLEVLAALGGKDTPELSDLEQDISELTDIASAEEKRRPQIKDPVNPQALPQMIARTPARIGVGRAGARLTTRTLLALRADHAAAQDSVYTDVDKELLERLGLPSFQTCCKDRDEHLTRPDLGRQFSQETLDAIRAGTKSGVQVQVFVSDGLSSKAIDANVENILPALTKGLEQYGIRLGAPFFVRFGRVPAMDVISELLESEVTCVLIGERPGLATAESMSAYIAYRATVGMPESRRTVVSNIHKGGISAVEAGAYIADVIKKMLELRCSGVELKL